MVGPAFRACSQQVSLFKSSTCRLARLGAPGRCFLFAQGGYCDVD